MLCIEILGLMNCLYSTCDRFRLRRDMSRGLISQPYRACRARANFGTFEGRRVSITLGTVSLSSVHVFGPLTRRLQSLVSPYRMAL